MMRFTARAFILACLLVAGNPSFADQASDRAAIEAINTQWLAAVAAKDAAGTAAFYAEDGMLMPAGAPAAVGRGAIASAWAGLYGLPGFALTFAATQIVVAASGDIAYDIGTYSLGFDGEDERIEDKGKYVVAWKNVDGQWLVAADIFNSDTPPSPPPSSSD